LVEVVVVVEGLSLGQFQEEEGAAVAELEFENRLGSCLGVGVEEGVS